MFCETEGKTAKDSFSLFFCLMCACSHFVVTCCEIELIKQLHVQIGDLSKNGKID